MHTGSRPQNPLLRPQHMQQAQQRRGNVACQGLFGLGLPEIAVIAGVTALIFGPSKLPELGKGLGKTVKSFQVRLGLQSESWRCAAVA
jgi:sec-independent protein translocase protein TatA